MNESINLFHKMLFRSEFHLTTSYKAVRHQCLKNTLTCKVRNKMKIGHQYLISTPLEKSKKGLSMYVVMEGWVGLYCLVVFVSG